MGEKHFCFFQTAETGNRTPNSGVKGSGANYTRAPALQVAKVNKDFTLLLVYFQPGSGHVQYCWQTDMLSTLSLIICFVAKIDKKTLQAHGELDFKAV